MDGAYVQTWPAFKNAGPTLKSLFLNMKMGIFSLLVASWQFSRLEESHATLSLCDFQRGKKSLLLENSEASDVCVCAVVWLLGFQLRHVNRRERAARGPPNDRERPADLNRA